MKDAHGNDIETGERVDTVVVTDVEDRFAVAHSVHPGAEMMAKVGGKLKKAKPPVHRPSSTAAKRTQKP